MKKLWIFAIAWLTTLTLAGCNYNKCDCNCPQCDTNCEEKVNESAQFCLENWWTYSQVTAPDEKYGECIFPSGIGCRDNILMTSECDFHPNLEDIDTEEERLAGFQSFYSSTLTSSLFHIIWSIDNLTGVALQNSSIVSKRKPLIHCIIDIKL